MAKLKVNVLEQVAYQKVKQMILSQQLPPGKKIVQDKLAQTLGISRTPLRSALQMLEAEQLVESIPRRGMIVRSFGPEEIIEIYECRIALESTAVHLFTHRATPPAIQKLRHLFAPFVATDSPVDEQAYRSADIAFHDAIVRQCGNGFLRKLFQQGNLLLYIDRIGLVLPPEETLSEHLAIIRAIAQRDADQAEALMKAHLVRSRQLLTQSPHAS